MESWIVGLMWLGAGVFLVFVLSLGASPKDARNLGAGRGGSSPVARLVESAGRGVLDAQALVEPDRRHLAQALRDEAEESSEEGDPPKAGDGSTGEDER